MLSELGQAFGMPHAASSYLWQNLQLHPGTTAEMAKINNALDNEDKVHNVDKHDLKEALKVIRNVHKQEDKEGGIHHSALPVPVHKMVVKPIGATMNLVGKGLSGTTKLLTLGMVDPQTMMKDYTNKDANRHTNLKRNSSKLDRN